MRKKAFSTGFEFKYKADQRFIPSPSTDEEMYVEPKYGNLKEEIVESGYLGMAQWGTLVAIKGHKYWNSESVRKIKKFGDLDCYQLSLEHLLVIILYCDFDALCTAFSETFRREHVFESIESVILRHSKFANFGLFLVEMVTFFGIKRNEGYDLQHILESGQSGPFYCGLNKVHL